MQVVFAVVVVVERQPVLPLVLRVVESAQRAALQPKEEPVPVVAAADRWAVASDSRPLSPLPAVVVVIVAVVAGDVVVVAAVVEVVAEVVVAVEAPSSVLPAYGLRQAYS